MTKDKSVFGGNLVCIKHPQYAGDSNPDLSCKICCSKFVARIRAEQASKFETTWTTLSKTTASDFQPMKVSEPSAKSAKRQANFDSSWV